jgi:NADPH:quinone reductase-like Zn-dependent oxidoreductase
MPTTMNAVLLLGHGGFEQLVYRSGVQIPAPGPDEVLVQVRAAGVNNTNAGPVVSLDLRTLYLKDLRCLGCTIPEPEVFAILVGYIERREIEAVVARTYPLREVAEAQRDFLSKRHTGKIVLQP